MFEAGNFKIGMQIYHQLHYRKKFKIVSKVSNEKNAKLGKRGS